MYVKRPPVRGAAYPGETSRCRANSAHIRRSRPDPGLGLSHVSSKSLLSCSLLARQRTSKHRGKMPRRPRKGRTLRLHEKAYSPPRFEVTLLIRIALQIDRNSNNIVGPKKKADLSLGLPIVQNETWSGAYDPTLILSCVTHVPRLQTVKRHARTSAPQPTATPWMPPTAPPPLAATTSVATSEASRVTVTPEPGTINPQPSTLNLQPSTLNPNP